jgi:hypothetical protein
VIDLAYASTYAQGTHRLVAPCGDQRPGPAVPPTARANRHTVNHWVAQVLLPQAVYVLEPSVVLSAPHLPHVRSEAVPGRQVHPPGITAEEGEARDVLF